MITLTKTVKKILYSSSLPKNKIKKIVNLYNNLKSL